MRKSAAPGGTHDDAIPNSSPSSYHCRRLDGVRFPFKGTPLTPVFLFCYCTYYTLYTLLLLCTAVLSRGILGRTYVPLTALTALCWSHLSIHTEHVLYIFQTSTSSKGSMNQGTHEESINQGTHEESINQGTHEESINQGTHEESINKVYDQISEKIQNRHGHLFPYTVEFLLEEVSHSRISCCFTYNYM